jgi:branched-subunit amino acid aminotransferase/4-amino-4-deoxychorismate lyase
MKVYLDGKIVSEDEARLSAFDAGVQHGIGLFETMRAYHGKVFRLQQHIDRLITSAGELGLTNQLRAQPLAEAVELTLARNELTEARIRLTITGGDLSMLAAARSGKKPEVRPTVMIHVTEPTVYPPEHLTDGVMAVIADAKANPFDPLASHKTMNYWARLSSLMQAAGAKAGEALWLTITNHLCGGAVSNAMLVKQGQLFTPIVRGEEELGALASPVLPGITRAAAIECASRLDIPVTRRMLTINDVLEADELFLTNTSWLVLPVVKVEGKTIGDGKVGPVTMQMYEALTKLIHTECAPAPAPDAAGDPTDKTKEA